MTYRVRNIVIAVVLAALAALMTSYYVTNYKRHVQQGEKHVQVYVASQDIPAGTSGADAVGMLKHKAVTQNAVAPGAIDTPLNKTAYTPEVRRNYEQRIGMHRIGTPAEIADVVLFVASDAARYMTGQELLVDGALTINGAVGHARD